MKLKKLYLFGLFLCLISSFCVSCENETEPEHPHVVPESPFQLKEISSTNPKTSVFYGSPDPGCGMPKTYSIYTDFEASELVLECTNLPEIHIDYKNSFFGDAFAGLEENPENWVFINEGNQLEIHFPFLEWEDWYDAYALSMILVLYSDSEEGILKDFVEAFRVPEMF